MTIGVRVGTSLPPGAARRVTSTAMARAELADVDRRVAVGADREQPRGLRRPAVARDRPATARRCAPGGGAFIPASASRALPSQTLSSPRRSLRRPRRPSRRASSRTGSRRRCSSVPTPRPSASSTAASARRAAGAGDRSRTRAPRATAAGRSAPAPEASSSSDSRAHDRHDAAADVRRRAELRHGAEQRVRDEAELGDLRRAVAALGDVVAVGLPLAVGQRAQDVAGGVLDAGAFVDAHGMTSRSPPSCARIFSRPRRMRPLTVPIGVSSIVAISVWVKPPK